MKYITNKNNHLLIQKISSLEKNLFDEFSLMLENNNFKYLSIPSIIKKETIEKQEIIDWNYIIKINDTEALSGSAEQGILELFSEQEVVEQCIYAKNQCFRTEKKYDDLKYCKEFIKLEQFVFSHKLNWEYYFDLVLSMATNFLTKYGIEYRIVDVTKRDKGYHILKKDIEVLTKTYGWMETHSCSYFGEEQSKRFNIFGATHTISNTGIASPRILVPFLEKENII